LVKQEARVKQILSIARVRGGSRGHGWITQSVSSKNTRFHFLSKLPGLFAKSFVMVFSSEMRFSAPGNKSMLARSAL
jgi:hypothetical protein